jgi:site-specific DNA-methyltransferase (adenine-specific)
MKENTIWHGLSTNTIYNMDCIEFVSSLWEQTIDLCFIDPPYNVWYKYNDYIDNMTHEQYIRWQIDLIEEIECKLKFWWSIVYLTYPELAAEIYTYFKYNKITLTPLKRATWVYNTNLWWKYLRKASRWIIRFWKWEPKKIWIRWEYKNPTDKRIKERIARWEKPKEMDWFYVDQVKNVSKKHDHPCEIPQAVVKKFIEWITEEWDLVMDCFMWSGSTALACLDKNRNYIWCDMDSHYVDIANNRIAALTK